MYLIQPHYHAIARTAQDYERMADAGVVAVAEPAFWAGFDRDYPETFLDYFKQITEFEPTRAAMYGIRHFSWLAVNPKEAENVELTAAVCKAMPQYLEAENCIGIGEIGLHKSTKNEITSFEMQVELALEHDQLILIHTPHLDDKLHGTKTILEVLDQFSNLNRDRVWIDHVEEHTVELVLDKGYWAGMTLYPQTKMSPRRAVDILEKYGWQRMLVNSSADWGPSDPFTLMECISWCRKRGFAEQDLIEIFHNAPVRFCSQSPKWDVAEIEIQQKS